MSYFVVPLYYFQIKIPVCSNRRSTETKRVPSRVGSKSSVREFRAACEKVLREQQEQIARVTELCQKLVQPQVAHINIGASCSMPVGQTSSDRDRGIVENKQICSKQQAAHSLDHNRSRDQAIQMTQSNIKEQQAVPSKVAKQNFGQNVKPVEPTDSSDSSTSNSSKELRRKERLRVGISKEVPFQLGVFYYFVLNFVLLEVSDLPYPS